MSKAAANLGLVMGTVVALVAVAHAEAPGWSRGQQELPITWEECVKRGNAAMQAEGYRIDQPSPFVVGIKGNHTALIMCNPSQNAKQWVNIVVASNSEGGGSERQRLQARMEGQSPAQPPGPPQPPPPQGEGACAGAETKVWTDKTTYAKNEPIKVSFRWKGKMMPRDWITTFPTSKQPHEYYLWSYVNDQKGNNCTWSTYISHPGTYNVAYLLDNGTTVLALGQTITITDSAPYTVQPSPPPTTTPPPAKPVQYLGCFKDSNSPFDLDGHLERSSQNTPQRCIQICAAKGFAYAGVQYGQSCLCGNRYGTQGQANNCNIACTGDSRSVCGGSYANSVYSTGR